MAAEQLQIQVQANVSNAVNNLNDLNKSLVSTNNAAVKTGTTGMQSLAKGANTANTAMINLGRGVSDAPFGFIGIANNIGPLVENFVQLKKESGSTGGALKQLGASLAGPGGVIVGIQLAVAAVQFAQLGFSRWFKSTKETKKETESLSETINSVTTNLSKEIVQVTKLVELIKSENTSRKLKKEAIDELIKVAPDYFDNLNKENVAIDKLDAAYQKYINTIQLRIRATVIEKQLGDIITAEQEINNLRSARSKDPFGLKNLMDQNSLRKIETLELKQQNKENAKILNLGSQKSILLNELIGLQQEINNIDGKNKVVKDKEKSVQDNINDLLKDYKEELAGIRYEGQIKGLNVSNQLLETNLNFLVRAAKLVGQTGQAYKSINADTQKFADAAANQKIVDVITAYQNGLSELDIKQAITGQDQLNARINAATDALIKLKTLGVQATNEEFIKLQNTLNGLQAEVGLREIRKRTEEITKVWERFQLQVNKLNFNKTKTGLDKLKSQIDITGNTIQDLKAKGLTDKDLGIQILSLQFEGLNNQFTKLSQQLEIFKEFQGILEQGLTSAFDNVFNAIADGENVFEALSQSVRQLVAELAKAVIKSLILKAIANAIAPGSGAAVSGIGSTMIRGDMLRNITLGR
jgi:hypothetical protein